MLCVIFFPAALLVVGAVASTEDVTARAQAAEEACEAPGAVPHPWDAQLLVLCGGEGRLVAMVRCPSGTVASAEEDTCRHPDTPQHHDHQHRHHGEGEFAGPIKRHIPFGEEDAGEDEDTFRAVHPLVRKQVGPVAADPGCEAGPGLRCADCDQLEVCSLGTNGYVTKLANVSCASAGDGLVCDKDQHACMPLKQGASCDQATANSFACLQPGAFPDPQDCQRYHICNDLLQHYTDTCDLAYDADNAVCVTEGEACTNPTVATPPCSENAAPIAIQSHKTFYRICLPESPKGYRSIVLKCPGQQTFDAKTGICSYACDTKKVRYPDPLNCHGFYDCPGESSAPSVPKKGTCATGLAFDAKKRMCVQEASVATCAPAVGNIPTPSSTPPAVVAPPTQQTPTNAPGQCVGEGVFADPSDCSRYIVCRRFNGNLVRNLRYCPAFTTFSVAFGGCRFGFCI